jgi:hypothetical protein
MNRVTEQLSSLQMTTWTLVVLILWFMWGTLMTGLDAFSTGFEQMNSMLVRDWLTSADTEPGILKFWFVGLLLVMGVLGVNLIFCSWNRILKIMRVKFSGPKLFMLIVHVVFGLVALGHFGGFMMGFRYERIPLYDGQAFTLEDGPSIKVIKVHFTDDARVLNKVRGHIMRDEFNYPSNYVEVAMLNAGHEVKRGRVYILRPLRHGSIQVTLARFIPANPSGIAGRTEGNPGVMLVISSNPVLNIFLMLYPLMIIGIVIPLIMTWRLPGKKNVNQNNG